MRVLAVSSVTSGLLSGSLISALPVDSSRVKDGSDGSASTALPVAYLGNFVFTVYTSTLVAAPGEAVVVVTPAVLRCCRTLVVYEKEPPTLIFFRVSYTCGAACFS